MFAQDEYGVDPRMNITGVISANSARASRTLLRCSSCDVAPATHAPPGMTKAPVATTGAMNLRRLLQPQCQSRYLPVSMAFGLPEPIDGMTPLLPTWFSFSPMEVRIASLIDMLYWPTFTKSRYVPLMVTVGVVM